MKVIQTNTDSDSLWIEVDACPVYVTLYTKTPKGDISTKMYREIEMLTRTPIE